MRYIGYRVWWQALITWPLPQLVMKASDQQPLLVLSGLVEGTYNYTLTVTSTTGTVGSDTATLRVAPNPLDDFLLQVHVAGEAATFSLAKQASVCMRAELGNPSPRGS